MLRIRLSAGEIGDIYDVQLTGMRRQGVLDWGWHIDRSRAGGGPLIDMGVHLIDLAMWLTGFPAVEAALCVTHDRLIRRQSAAGGRRSATVEDMATGLVRCAGSMSLHVATSLAAHMPSEETTPVRLVGSEGGLEVFPPRLWNHSRHADRLRARSAKP
jgi:predicted dehydrogenase